MSFEIVGAITRRETIAEGNSIRDLQRLRDTYGGKRWRKLKGIAMVRLSDGTYHTAEIHWYEAVGPGPQDFKIKYLMD